MSIGGGKNFDVDVAPSAAQARKRSENQVKDRKRLGISCAAVWSKSDNNLSQDSAWSRRRDLGIRRLERLGIGERESSPPKLRFCRHTQKLPLRSVPSDSKHPSWLRGAFHEIKI